LNIHDLGTLTGTLMLFGGPYSNLQALQAFLREADRRKVPHSRIICTGDVAGYCAHPGETVALLRDTGISVVAGNVERQLAEGAQDCGCGFEPGSTCEGLSAAWFAHADRAIDGAAREWMKALPDVCVFTHEGLRYAVVHGGLSDISRFLWPTTPDADFAQEIAAIAAACGPVDGVISGHCGLAFERVIGDVHWINAGVIGMPPHDMRPDTRFVVLSKDGARIERLSYDAKGAAQAMQKAGLTQGYDTALISGIWPSEDILPAEMRS